MRIYAALVSFACGGLLGGMVLLASPLCSPAQMAAYPVAVMGFLVCLGLFDVRRRAEMGAK